MYLDDTIIYRCFFISDEDIGTLTSADSYRHCVIQNIPAKCPEEAYNIFCKRKPKAKGLLVIFNCVRTALCKRVGFEKGKA